VHEEAVNEVISNLSNHKWSFNCGYHPKPEHGSAFSGHFFRNRWLSLAAVLRDYINATIGFEELSQVFDKSSKSLMRMFGPKGNPQASNLFAVIHYLQEQEGIHLEVKARKVA
jgi:DNA-binding phage protein